MDNEISNDYIKNAINELSLFFGVKEPISGEKIFSLIRGHKIKEATKIIASQLGLPIDVNIIYVPSNYQQQNKNNAQFSSTYLVKAQTNNNGTAGIVAQVDIPGNLPFYGSSSLKDFLINVKISKNCTEHPVVFCMIMAHEFSHILLYSLNHTKKENEFYTDLTAIILGFQNIFQNGRKIVETEQEYGIMTTKTRTRTTTYGYLNDNQFDFAKHKINSILSKSRDQKQNLKNILNRQKKILKKFYKNTFIFKKYLKFLYKNNNKKFDKNDLKQISLFFQSNYLDSKEQFFDKCKNLNKEVNNFLLNCNHYNEQKNNLIEKYKSELKKEKKNVDILIEEIKKDIKIIKKYINPVYKIKVFFISLKNNYEKNI